ncbi:MAG: phosphate signaling complex protein PhoU [Rhodobacteraceae bacterium]|nr:phosphate signaling complex protein PhoU [Paracoccaceae bacterium]
MKDTHIISAFDRDLADIETLMTQMGDLTATAILDAAAALHDQNEPLSEQVRRKDAAIDALERQIAEDAARIIALRAPRAVDLRVVLAVIKVASNLERIGDYAKNISKRNAALSNMATSEQARGGIQRMAKEACAMLRDGLRAYLRRDRELAYQVVRRDQDLDEMYNDVFRVLLTFMLEDPRQIASCMHLHFVAKNIERMGDHVTSIAEQAIYLVEGEHPGGDRPKGDTTSGYEGAAPQ